MTLRLWLSLFAVIGATAIQDTPAEAAIEDACEAERDAFQPPYREGRSEGVERRRELLAQLAVLIERYQGRAPVCEGRLREHEAYLLVMNKEYSEVVRRVSAFLDRTGSQSAMRTQIGLRIQKGWCLVEMGRTLEGHQEYYAAAALARRAPASNGSRALIYASTSSRLTGDVPAAQRYLDEAFRILGDSLSSDSTLHDHLGHVLVSQGLLAEYKYVHAVDDATRQQALVEMEKASEQAIKELSGSSRYVLGLRSLAMNLYALAAAFSGQHDAAHERVAPALDLARYVTEEVPTALTETWLVRSQIAELAGDLETARDAALQAREDSRRRSAARTEAEALERLGRIAEAQEQFEEAATHYALAIRLREVDRERVGLQDWNSQAFANMQAPYRGLIRTRLAIGDAVGALQVLDQTQARYLRDLRHHLITRNGLSDRQRADADSLISELETARLALLRHDIGGPEQAELMRTMSQLQGSLESITGTPPLSASSLNVGQLKSALGERVLVAYFLDDHSSTAFVVRPDTLVTVPLDITPASVRAQLRSVGTPWDDAATTDPAFALAPLHALYQDVMAPLAPWLEGARALTIIPDGALSALPFAMLTTDRAESYEDAPYLVRTYAITTELAPSLLLDVPAQPTETDLDVLAYGRSQFGAHEPLVASNPLLGDLPHVEDEVRQIARRVPRQHVELDDDATEAQFVRDLGTARIVHVASHAEAHPVLPLYSRILLADDPAAEDDGMLYLYEIQGRSIPADLVVLSGCSTASGAIRAGEGIVGLHYAVRTAGAKSSLATLWPVEDEATVSLMAAFYAGLADGLPKDEALQRAQITYLKQTSGLRASPFFWAAPVLSGDPSAVPIRGSDGNLLAMLALAAALTVGLAWALYSRRYA